MPAVVEDRQVLDSEAFIASWHVVTRDAEQDFAPHHQAGDLALVHVRGPLGCYPPAVAQHGQPIGDGPDLPQPMRDEHDRQAVRDQLTEHHEQPVDLLRREQCRRLVEDQRPHVLGQRAKDLDALALADCQPLDPSTRINLERVARRELRDSRTLFVLIHDAAA